MSIQPVDPSSGEVYCDVERVSGFFEKYEDGFDQNTQPPASHVRSLIAEASDYIDQYTNHAWRERRVNGEMKNIMNRWNWQTGTPIQLMKQDVRTPLDPEQGDELRFWEANSYEDWLTNEEYEYGRDNDYWIEEETGTLYVYRRPVFNRIKQIEISYRYGKQPVPAAIENAAAKLAAADLMESDFYNVTVPGNEDQKNPGQIAETWREEVRKRLDRYKRIQIAVRSV